MWFILHELQVGKYVWRTYKEVYDDVILIGVSIRHVGVQPVSMFPCVLHVYLIQEILNVGTRNLVHHVCSLVSLIL
jgi:hypothetical protein